MFPKPSEVPSETTISILSSHHILDLVASPKAWSIAPTTNQERHFAYDASLRGFKLAVLQYKRISSINRRGGFSITLNPSQLTKLRNNFPRRQRPYVFVAYSTHASYQTLAFDYEQIGAPQFMGSMVFIDAHALPANISTIRNFPNGDVCAHLGGRRYTGPIRTVDGTKFASDLKNCHIGLTGTSVKEVLREETMEALEMPLNLHYFLWKMEDAR